MNDRSFFAELKRRKVYKVAVVGWLVIQINSTVLPTFHALGGCRLGLAGFGAFLDQCELQVDRADGKGMVLLAIDTTPGYVDTQPFPSAPAKWTYQAIYRVGDERVGQWSAPVSVNVGG